MPYITQEAREKFKGQFGLKAFADLCSGPGDLNYLITRLLVHYIKKLGESYATYNEVIGVLECAKMELARRRLASYESDKHRLNGDVY